MRIVASEAARAFIVQRGGCVWVWLDPHQFVGGGYVWLAADTAPPGDPAALRSARRMKSARRPHRFRSFEAEGIEVFLDPGRIDPPAELQLDIVGWPKKKVRAYWNGSVFVEEDREPFFRPGSGSGPVTP